MSRYHDYSADTGINRSIPVETDPKSAFIAEGFFAGYGRTGIDGCPYDQDHNAQANAWLLGYYKGMNLRLRLVGERIRRSR